MRDPHRPWPGFNRNPNAGGGEGKNPTDDVKHRITPEQVTVPSFLEDLPEVREEVAIYTNAVQRLDASFGKAMAALQASGKLGQTIVLFVSDHGMPFPLSKATCYANGHWCPVVIRWPGMGTPQQVELMTQSIDLMPTLLELLGVAKPDTDGRSWVPLLKGEKQDRRDHIINNVNGVANGSHYPMRVVQTKTAALVVTPRSDGKNRMVGVDSVSGRSFKAMEEAAATDPKIKKRVEQYTVGYPMAFYDLVQDPDQRENQISNPAYKDEIKRLQDVLMDHMVTTKDPQLDNYKTILAGKTCSVDIKGKGRRNRNAD